MRVVIAGDFPERPPDIVGGIQAVIYYTLERLACYPDLELHIVSCEKWWNAVPQKMTVRKPGWSAHYLPSPARLPHTVSMLTVDRWQVANTIRSLSPDVIHAHGQASAYPWAALGTGLPTILTVHGITYLEARLDPRGGPVRSRLRAFLWEKAENAVLHRSKDLVVISPFVAEVIKPHTHARLHWIENPVCSDLFALERRSPIPGRILFVGTVKRCKGLTDLIRALHLVKDHYPEAHLRIAGGFTQVNDAYVTEVNRLVAALDLEERVDFLGQVDHARLLEEYDRCTLFCLPSYLEASPVCVAEAMAAGCPVITSQIEGTAHLIRDSETGFRTPVADAPALAEKINLLFANPELQYHLGGAARGVATSRFNPAVAAEATHQLYRTFSS